MLVNFLFLGLLLSEDQRREQIERARKTIRLRSRMPAMPRWRRCHGVIGLSLSPRPSEAKFAAIRVGEVEEPFAPFGILRCRVWTVAGMALATESKSESAFPVPSAMPPEPIRQRIWFARTRKSAIAVSYSRSAASRSGVPSLVASRAIWAAITRSSDWCHC
jgi:hypothetical protein